MRDLLSEARKYIDLGYSPIPLQPGGKKPLGPWKEFQKRRATESELVEWFRDRRNNIGIVCGAVSEWLYVKDFDDRAKAEEHWRRYRGLIKTIVETPRGWHFYYRMAFGRNAQGDKEDDRGDGGYVVAPPSLVSNKQYKFVEGHGLVRPEELCEFPEDVVSKRLERKIAGNISDVRAYIRAIKSIQGQRGSDACFRAACVLRDAGFSEAETLEELIAWNVVCASPAWSLRELTHKARDAFAKAIRK